VAQVEETFKECDVDSNGAHRVLAHRAAPMNSPLRAATQAFASHLVFLTACGRAHRRG
jgi:hypothetical protein